MNTEESHVRIDLTPTMHIQPADQEAAASKTAERLAKVLADVEQAEAVVVACEAFDAATRRRDGLSRGINELNRRKKVLLEENANSGANIEKALLSHFIDGTKPPDSGKEVDTVLRNTAEVNMFTGLIDRIGSHLLPASHIALMYAQHRVLLARADELTAVANARFEQTAALLREATEIEGGLVIDTRGTLSGQLIKEAALLKSQPEAALTAARNAERQQAQLQQQINKKG
jgi:hypothetical protein